VLLYGSEAWTLDIWNVDLEETDDEGQLERTNEKILSMVQEERSIGEYYKNQTEKLDWSYT